MVTGRFSGHSEIDIGTAAYSIRKWPVALIGAPLSGCASAIGLLNWSVYRATRIRSLIAGGARALAVTAGPCSIELVDFLITRQRQRKSAGEPSVPLIDAI